MTLTDGPQHERSEAPLPPPTPPLEPAPPMTPAPAPAPVSEVRTATRSRFEPDTLLTALVGLVLLILGLIVITRAGFGGPMATPVVKVLGFTHTTTLGLIEIGLGVCLLLSGASRSRNQGMFFGGVLGVAGFVGAVQSSSFHTSLALESSMAWLAAIAGFVVVIAALALPRFARDTTTVHQA